MQLKNVILDLGGVLINVDFNKTKEAFEKLGVKDYANFFSQHHASPLFQDLETGKISEIQFYDGLRSLSGLTVSNEEIETAWNAMLGNFELPNLQWLAALKNNYRVFLFSNTNAIHYKRFAELCQSQTGNSIESYFETAYFSHTLGLRKPAPDSFRFILEKEKLIPSETLFVDDTIGNIDGAQSVGLRTYHLKKIEDLNTINL